MNIPISKAEIPPESEINIYFGKYKAQIEPTSRKELLVFAPRHHPGMVSVIVEEVGMSLDLSNIRSGFWAQIEQLSCVEARIFSR